MDFCNLNQASLKDNYPLLVMDQVLQAVTGFEMLSMLDDFFGYNQIEVREDDQYKTTFTTPWGTFAYRQMPFGLINVGATFQRAIDLAFDGLINESIITYLDDLTVYSKKCQDHFFHLRQVLERCRQHGVSLNTKSSILV